MPAVEPLPFFRSLETFAPWSESRSLAPALIDLARRAEVWTFVEGDFVRFPDEGPAGPTWVAEGCLAVQDGAVTRYVGVRETLEAPPGVWVRGQTAGRLVIVPENLWHPWLRRYPEAAERLGVPVPLALPRGFRHSPLVLEPGETPRHLFRKSPVFWGLRASLPGLFFLLFLGFGILLQLRFGTTVAAGALWFLPGLGMAVSGALVGLVSWEWSTSVLAITDRSILVRQVDLWSHRSDFEKLALDRIREIVYSRQGWLEGLLGLVNAEIEADSPQGRIRFPGLGRSSEFLKATESLRHAPNPGGINRRAIRRALASRAGGARTPSLERPADHRATPVTRRLSWRVEKNGGIWFRRHPWFVWRRSLPWLGWTALVVFLGVFAWATWPAGGLEIAGVTAAVALGPLGRIGWEIWDWADDRLSIQQDRILLVHRRPLGLGEVRQEGTLDQVQQVGVRKATLAGLLFDFGTVTVSLGASDPLVFEDASHPEWVQNEIFHRRTLVYQDRERQEAQARLDEMGEVLETWDEAQKVGYFRKER